jgi:hypothetical protein
MGKFITVVDGQHNVQHFYHDIPHRETLTGGRFVFHKW